MGDVHVEVVDDHREVVGGRAIRARDDEIVEFLVAEAEPTTDEIVEHHIAVIGIAEPDDRLDAGRGRSAALAAVTVVARFLLVLQLLGAQRVDALSRAVAAVGGTRGEHAVDDLGVALEALRLVVGTLVVVELQPRHAVENGVDRLLGRTLPVGVLDAQHEAAAVTTRVEPAEQRRACATDVQIPRRTRGKTGTDLHVRDYSRLMGAVRIDRPSGCS